MTNKRPWVLSTLLGGITTLLHILTATDSYGYFRDELYYLANARHLGFGYVEHPPMIGWITWFERTLFGDSQLAIRLLPAVAAGVTVFLVCRIAAEMGGQRFAQLLAGVATALAPGYVGVFGILSMNAFDIMFWAAAVLIVTRLLRTGDSRLWLAFGLVAGLGLENKISLLFLGFGLVAGLILDRQWHHFTGRWLWLGGALAGLLFLPYLVWQAQHDWAMLEFMSRATQFKNLPLLPTEFLSAQMLQMNPVAVPIALAALAFYFFTREGRPFQPLGWAVVVILLVMISQRAKPYYFAPAFPLLLAPGGVLIENLTGYRGWRWIRPAYPVLIVLSGFALVPLAKPVLPVEAFVRYQARLGMAPRTSERHELERLPQDFADRLGWQELAETVAEVYHSLPSEDRARACIFGHNYGQAGAIDFFGPELGLPSALSGHNTYWWWGPGECRGEVLIIIGGGREAPEEFFEQVELAATFTCQDCMPYENNKSIWVCRGLSVPIDEIWPSLRSYN